MTVEELITDSRSLLSEIIHNAYSHTDGEEFDLTAAYSYRLGRYIYQLGEEYCSLEEDGHFHGAPIILRTMLESLFSLSAITNCTEFAGNQILNELDDLQNALNTDEKDSAEINSQLSELKKKAQNTYKLKKPKKYKIIQIAEIADLSNLYETCYRWLCSATHPTIRGMITSESGGTLGMRLDIYSMTTILTSGNIARTIQTSSPQDYVDQATALLDELLILKESKAFRSFDINETDLKISLSSRNSNS